ncbi:DUF402 domain-containing protein [Paenibacillus sp. NPDC057967]|uniref:DUF402 domain-containing protein n=1 Tax=Paenibacillus sp. NPDC057967 TaxID=3346293 RepID=UPI0036D9714A
MQFENVNSPITFRIGQNDELIIIDDQYTWLEHIPDEGHHILTTVINSKGEVIQHYFDVIAESSLTDEGIPYFDDLYIDVILLPNNEIYILDEDELLAANNDKVISVEQFDLAVKEKEIIRTTLMENRNYLIHRWERDCETLKVMISDIPC